MSFVGGTPNNFDPRSTPGSSKTELKPLEVNGITAVTLGTIFWAISLVVLVLLQDWLRQNDRLHWIWISVSGIVLGLLGYRYTTNRVMRLGLDRGKNFFGRMKKAEPDQSKLIHDFE